jgi:hypothetical protein
MKNGLGPWSGLWPIIRAEPEPRAKPTAQLGAAARQSLAHPTAKPLKNKRRESRGRTKDRESRGRTKDRESRGRTKDVKVEAEQKT